MNLPRKFMIEARCAKKLSQQKLADLVRISQTAIAAYESGARRPSYEVAVRVGELLDIDWMQFFK